MFTGLSQSRRGSEYSGRMLSTGFLPSGQTLDQLRERESGLVMLSSPPLFLLKSDWATAEQCRIPAVLYMGSDLEPDLVRRQMDEGTYGFTCLM